MYTINRNDLESLVKKTDISKYSHIIICLNQDTGSCFLRFVLPNENIENVKKGIENKGIYGMLSIDESYDCCLIEKELSNPEPLKLNISKRVQSALSYATRMHQFQYRHDGSAYINHPLRVANYVKKFKDSTNLEDLYISALLHDVIEDTQASYCDIVKMFGPQVASVVLELTNDEDLKHEVGKTKYLEIKMKNMSSWALVIKLCDRLDNVSDLMSSGEQFRYKYIAETIEIINFLLENRNLSETHINIIKAIIERIIFTIDTCEYEEYQEPIIQTKNKVRTLNEKPSPCHKR